MELLSLLPASDLEELAKLLPACDRTPPAALLDDPTLPPFDVDKLKNSNHLRDSAIQLQYNIADGYYAYGAELTMLADESDEIKKYDEWKEQNIEEYWGAALDKTLTDDLKELHGTIDLAMMCAQNLIQVGDTLVYKRTLSSLNVSFLEEVQVTKVVGTVDVLYGKKAWKDIKTPTALETLIFNTEKTLKGKKIPNGNAWKSIRVHRDGKPQGSLGQLRLDLMWRIKSAGGTLPAPIAQA
ncbi:hypothetical protein BDK51DRAFT_31410 [Blyttiomyces helicus]|uniref:ASX DEUBAD domain-containing protein n=1 Tax=Blyttiomyces helicus TaxID=388810 RepID=A0A4P9WFK4_9FUNG|nr:hypothetical protein BDK51DRAFT_31410 [Blyttiomyces helicus]|eukprot:RKO90645.1 hypothetical protein BDK51DRAFT_31410 [Blyttiomyces helicus]